MLPQDPFILLSLANTKLRDGCGGLADLCAALNTDPETLTGILGAVGYAYDPAANQFKPV